MSRKSAISGEGGDDILGLVAFGSLVANILKIAFKKSLGEQREALKVYSSELRRHYENMKIRERQVYNENLELRRANEGLIAVNNRLLKELVEAREEYIRLGRASTQAPRYTRRQVRMKKGGVS